MIFPLDIIEELQLLYTETISKSESDIVTANLSQLNKYILEYKKYLENDNFEIIEEIADGNCLFRCISRQIYGVPDNHLIIRNRCVDYIKTNKDFFIHFIDSDFNSYCNSRRSSGIFADDIEITSACQLYSRNIEIYSYDINNDYKPYIIKTFTPLTPPENEIPIRLEYIIFYIKLFINRTL